MKLKIINWEKTTCKHCKFSVVMRNGKRHCNNDGKNHKASDTCKHFKFWDWEDECRS